MAEYEKIEDTVVRDFTTYVMDPPPVPGQDLRCVVDNTNGTMKITLTDPATGVYIWDGLLVAAPLIYDLLGHVIADQAANLVPEEG